MDSSTINKKLWFGIDPTIHAGHILTAVTIVFCSLGAWYNLTSTVASLKEDALRQEKRIDKIEAATSGEVIKMRDDMNVWFMRIDDKLDKKMDKK